MKTVRVLLFFGLCVAARAQLPVNSSEARGRLRVSALLAEGRSVKIACFGDSITGVYYHTGRRRSWCDLLGIALARIHPQARIEMINAGVSGNDTGGALKRMENDVLRHAPHLVVVMFGMNDLRSLAPIDFRNNLESIVRRARDRGAEVILMTPNAIGPDDPVRPPARLAEYAEIVRNVAREQELPVVDAYSIYAAILAADRPTWERLMSDTIHPNMRGHKIFAEEVARAITGRRVSLAELPELRPGLPWVQARLQARQPVRLIAMPPYDALIGPALRNRFPDAVVEVTAWHPDAGSLAAIEAQAKENGWWKYRREPGLPPPDLVIVAVPSTARAPTEGQYYRSYSWIINWSLNSGIKPGPEWDCLVVLPSVAERELNAERRHVEEQALEVIRGQDIPWLQRQPGDPRSPLELLSGALDALLDIVATTLPAGRAQPAGQAK